MARASRYVITPQFTAFVGYDEGTHTAQLLYSWDAGSTWLTSALGHGVQAPSYISVVGDRIGVAYGYGDTLGSVGYAMVAARCPNCARMRRLCGGRFRCICNIRPI